MIVNSVSLSNTSFDMDTSQHKAVVTLNMTGTSGTSFDLSFSCQTALPKNVSQTMLLNKLVQHATEQAHRLPAFRAPGSMLKFGGATRLISAA